MTDTFLATPDNWFDMPSRIAACADAGASLDLTLIDSDGRRPLSDVALDELRAIHHTFGSWWRTLGGDARPASLRTGAYESFLTGSRALLKDRAEAILARPGGLEASALAPVMFPSLDHVMLADPQGALAFFTSFLAVPDSPSLVAWARARADADAGVVHAATHAWFRVVLQKVAVEDDLPEALACLRTVYGVDEAARRELLKQESQLLEQCGLEDLQQWARALGLDRPTRPEPEVRWPRRHVPDSRDEPDVTVLVPSYGHEAFIEAALESVLAQTYSGFRLLVVDDGSSDGTVERAARIRDPRLQIEVNARNLGLGDSVLSAVDRMTTPFVALLNSDDLFHPDRLERCLAVLKASARVQVVATGVTTIDRAGRPLSVDTVSRLCDGSNVANWIQWFADAGHVDEGADLLSELLERNFLVTSSNIVCRTEFLRSRRDLLRGLKYCLDWQVFLEAALDGALAHVPEELVSYRLHPSNTVWFDDARGAEYGLEANRVLACALRRLLDGSSPSQDARHVARILDLLALRAGKHSEANGFLLYAAELLGGRTLEDTAVRSDVVRVSLRLLSQLNKTTEPGQRDRDESAVASRAAGVVAEISREEAVLAVRETEQARREAEQARRETEQARRETEQARRETEQALRDTEGLREQVIRSEQALRQEREQVARTRVSPEWIVGHTLWNRAGLSRVGFPAARGVRRLQDRLNRWRLTIGRTARNARITRPRAVVAACWSFPILSQTFVYQEVQALSWAGFDCRFFCCDTNPKSDLPEAFSGLWRKRVEIRSEREQNQRDLEHFLHTHPGRVEVLLDRLSEATGMAREALLQESVVLMGFTFARYVELSGAVYLHTYFFYDQSFMALMAACLLQIPRGVTAYADHMLGDYPFKCVPLHLDLADIVVATSSRIRDELSAIGGGQFDSKILVKPNGIDTSRFANVSPAQRLAQGGDPELISVSRIEPKKGLTYLVEAVNLLIARGVFVRLHIVGGVDLHTTTSAEYFREVTERIAVLGLAGRVVLHGSKQQHEFVPLLVRSRIFVAPYVETSSGDKDGIPTALLEAMSTGLPVVATNAGSLAEAATDGVEALSVPQRDPVRLADAIERLLTDDAMYARMADAARRRAVSEFDVHVTEARLHERIEVALSRRGDDLGAPVRRQPARTPLDGGRL